MQLHLSQNHSQTDKSAGPESWEWRQWEQTSCIWHEITCSLSKQQDKSGSENRPNCTWHEITHLLSSQQDQSGSEGNENRPSGTWCRTTHLLSTQQGIIGVKAVRTNTAAPGMKSLTPCQTNRTKVGTNIVRTDLTCHKMTHKLSGHQASRTKMKVKAVRSRPAAPVMKSLTCCQANSIIVGVMTVRIDSVAPGMQLLTSCQAHRTRVEVKVLVRADPAAAGMQSLTNCQANRTRLGVKAVRMDLAIPATNHSQTIKKRRPECKGSQWEQIGNCTYHEITHFLTGQQDQSENEQRGNESSKMKLLTCCEVNRTSVNEDNENRPGSCIWHEITHLLLNQQDQSENTGSENRSNLPQNHSFAVKPKWPDWEWKQWGHTQLHVPWNHSPPVKPTTPEWEWR